MKKFLTIAVLSITAMLVLVPGDKVRAGLTDYDTYFTARHIYDSNSLIMSFDNLDTSSSYRWTVSLVNEQTGDPFFDIGHYTHVPGTATDFFTLGPIPATTSNHMGDWPFQYTGPIQVRDNFGQIVMRGFVAPDPALYTSAAVWEAGTGNNAWVDKVVMGSPTHVIPDQNPVYNNIDSGWHYAPDEFQGAAVGPNEYAIMHFNLDCATYNGAGYGANDGYYIYDFGGTEVGRFPFLELADYQNQTLGGINPICSIANDEVFESFIPINIEGDNLPFLANTRANEVFVTYQNPNTFSLEPGAYYIQKRVGGVWIADGEAPFFVSNADKGFEWDIDIGSFDVQIGGIQNYTFRQSTEEIWDDYHGTSLCGDTSLAWSDTNTYSFAEARDFAAPVSGSLIEGETASCIIVPLSIGTTQMTATEARIIYTSPPFDVIAGNASVENAINQLIVDSKLNNDTGRNLVFAGLLALSMLGVTAIPIARGNLITYLIVWTGVGGVWAFAGPITPLGLMMFTITTVVLWFMALQTGKLNGSGNSDASF